MTYVVLEQTDVGSFVLPMKRPINRLESKTIEHAIDLPVVRYVDVPQDRPTVENLISIPQIHYTMVKQILPT